MQLEAYWLKAEQYKLRIATHVWRLKDYAALPQSFMYSAQADIVVLFTTMTYETHPFIMNGEWMNQILLTFSSDPILMEGLYQLN